MAESHLPLPLRPVSEEVQSAEMAGSTRTLLPHERVLAEMAMRQQQANTNLNLHTSTEKRDHSNIELKKRPTNFFSLPQILRQRILFMSLPHDDIVRIAQISLRLSQDDYLDEQERRYVSSGRSVDHDATFFYFIKCYSQNLAVHWIIFHDLKLVRKIWHAVYTRYPRIFDDFDNHNRPSSGPYVASVTGDFAWWPKADLDKLENEYNVAGRRTKSVTDWSKKKPRDWVTITSTSEHFDYDYYLAWRKGIKLLRGLGFDALSKVSFPAPHLPMPKLGYHEQKEFPGFAKLNPIGQLLPVELIQQILLELLPFKHVNRLAKAQFHHKRAGVRFVASLCVRLGRVHPGFIPSLAYVKMRWIQDITQCIDDYRAEHASRVEQFRVLLKRKREVGDVTQEEVDEREKYAYSKMREWQAETSELNLLALEDMYDIPEKERSTATRKLRTAIRKTPEKFVSTIHGKYRYAKSARRDYSSRGEDLDKKAIRQALPWYTGSMNMDADDYLL